MTARIVPRRDASASVLRAYTSSGQRSIDEERRPVATDRVRGGAGVGTSAKAEATPGVDDDHDETGAATYRVVAGTRYNNEGERLFIAKFPPTINEEVGMTKNEGNLGLGKWKIARGLDNQSIEGSTQTVAKVGTGLASMPKRRSYFDDNQGEECPGWTGSSNFTLQEVTSEILGAGATVAAQKEKQVFAGGARFIMLYVEEGAEPNTFYAVPSTDMWRCNLMSTKTVDGEDNDAGAVARDAGGGVGPSSKKQVDDDAGDEGFADSLKSLFSNRRAHGSGKAVANMEENKLTEDQLRKRRVGSQRIVPGGDNDWEHAHGVASDDDEEIGYGGEALDMPDEMVTFGWSEMLQKEQDDDDADLLRLLDRIDADEDSKAGDEAGRVAAAQNGEGARQDRDLEDDAEATAPKAKEVHITRTAGVKREREDGDDESRKHQKKSNANDPSGSQVKVTKEEVRTLLRSRGGLMSSRDLSKAFKGRLVTQEDKKLFADIVKSIAKKATEKNQKGMIILK